MSLLPFNYTETCNSLKPGQVTWQHWRCRLTWRSRVFTVPLRGLVSSRRTFHDYVLKLCGDSSSETLFRISQSQARLFRLEMELPGNPIPQLKRLYRWIFFFHRSLNDPRTVSIYGLGIFGTLRERTTRVKKPTREITHPELLIVSFFPGYSEWTVYFTI